MDRSTIHPPLIAQDIFIPTRLLPPPRRLSWSCARLPTQRLLANAVLLLVVAAGSPGHPGTRRRLRTDDRTDWPRHRRPETGRRAVAHGAVQPRALPARRRAGAGQDAAGQHGVEDSAPV